MLMIIEILFMIIGIWGLIKGKFPGGLFRFVFGKGDYNLPPKKARLFGLLLISPWPMALLMTFIFTLFLGKNALTFAMVFEIVYDLVVITTAVIIARKVRQPNVVISSEMPPALPGTVNNKSLTPSKKTILIFLLVSLGCIVVTSFGALIITWLSVRFYGGSMTGNSLRDSSPIILIALIISGGIVGVILIAKRLKRG